VAGTSEAPDQRAALESLRESGLFVTQLAPARRGAARSASVQSAVAQGAVTQGSVARSMAPRSTPEVATVPRPTATAAARTATR
jgi:hypothetical protein